MAAAIRRGRTYSHPLTFVDAYRNPIDKSSCEFLAQVRHRIDSEDVVVEFTDTLTGAGNNVVVLSLTAEETETLPIGTHVWELRETNGAGVLPRVEGEAVVRDSIVEDEP